MLVLSRKLGEKIDIGGGVKAGGITITLIDIDRNKVRLGVEAPRDILVNRAEIQAAIDAEAETHKYQKMGDGPMIQVTIHTPTPTPQSVGLPPEFRDFDGTIDSFEFPTPYEAALHLLSRCSLADLQDLALRKLIAIRNSKIQYRPSDDPYVADHLG